VPTLACVTEMKPRDFFSGSLTIITMSSTHGHMAHVCKPMPAPREWHVLLDADREGNLWLRPPQVQRH
jgi:hypothetical protein